MSPERILGSNVWKLAEGEFIEGDEGRVEGPQIVRVLKLPKINKLQIQTEDDRKIGVDGTDFESVVQKK